MPAVARRLARPIGPTISSARAAVLASPPAASCARASDAASPRSRSPRTARWRLARCPPWYAELPEARVLWLDAHSDYDTPETSTIGFLGCMSLAGATGAWDAGLGTPFARRAGRARRRARRAGGVRRCRTRGRRRLADDGDPARRHAARPTCSPRSATRRCTSTSIPTCSTRPRTRCRTPGPAGLELEAVAELLRAVADRGPVVGVEITAFHTDDHRRVREALADRLIECVRPLLYYFSQSPTS